MCSFISVLNNKHSINNRAPIHFKNSIKYKQKHEDYNIKKNMTRTILFSMSLKTYRKNTD